MGSNFIPFEGMEFDATVSLLPCWGWRGAKSARPVMGFSLAFKIFWQRPTGSSSIAGIFRIRFDLVSLLSAAMLLNYETTLFLISKTALQRSLGAKALLTTDVETFDSYPMIDFVELRIVLDIFDSHAGYFVFFNQL